MGREELAQSEPGADGASARKRRAGIVPSLQVEQALWRSGKLRVAGVDEVGLGSICGPVVACAVLLPAGCRMIERVRDSKALTAGERERLFAVIVAEAAAVGLGAASVKEVDALNVLRASHLAMRRALARLGPYDHALVDGRPIKDADLGPHTAIVDGDATSYAIACASIVAKVTRDRLMHRLARFYPGYAWETNVGYGTPEHLEALRKLGLTPLHRRTYAPVQAVLLASAADNGEAKPAAAAGPSALLPGDASAPFTAVADLTPAAEE